MRLPPQTLAVLLFGYASTVAAVSYNDKASEIACTTGLLTGRVIDGIAYRNSEQMPLIHFKGGSWAYLSWHEPVTSYRGRALLVMALTAYETGARVDAECTDFNDVTGLWIRDF
ncbi:hypothetical protein [Burkholderia pyrrocinia]|uniref:hypothetical protein n=1 Tax=Burkholderia pyrrocinia TaxID=60550 RepID=UPI00158CD612|nr:hypothetical protein [Burkholderia pyrrocinia]